MRQLRPPRKVSRMGITLIELLVVVVIMAIVTVGVVRAYVEGINYDNQLRTGSASLAKIRNFENKITDLIHHAELSQFTTQQASYFIGSMGDVPAVTAPATATGTTTPTPPTQNSSSNGSGNSDTLIFTMCGARVPSTQLESDDDFETQNQNHGPIGGIHEISLATTPIGSPPNNQTGLFLREQIPADLDPSQGGNESLLEPDVTSIQFEFWDGTQYDPTWDTRTMTPARLPAAVRVTYQLTGDTTNHMFVVMVPASDVTATNPVVQTGTASTTTP